MVVRMEDRYFASMLQIEEILDEIGNAKPKLFPTGHNHTIYFNNHEHETPFGVSVSGRRHSTDEFDGHLSHDGIWIFGVKRDFIQPPFHMRKKESHALALKEILQKVSTDAICGNASPLFPYCADSCRRRHFQIGSDENFRITVDDNIRYYFFEQPLHAIPIGEEGSVRMEIKVPLSRMDSKEFHAIQRILNEKGAEPAISREDMLYNLITAHMRNKADVHYQKSDTEIEAKLSLTADDQSVFHMIKDDFMHGIIHGFSVPEEFSYTLQEGSLQRYILGQVEGKSLRLSIKGRSKSVTSKKDSEVKEDNLGLHCIIKRSEIEEPFNDSLLLLPSMALYRKRKYFAVKNNTTGTSYCISMDRCTSGYKELYQMEIEGLLLAPSNDEENKLVDDIAYLTNALIKRYPELKPTIITKSGWLRGDLAKKNLTISF
jgi:hypothetical protein